MNSLTQNSRMVRLPTQHGDTAIDLSSVKICAVVPTGGNTTDIILESGMSLSVSLSSRDTMAALSAPCERDRRDESARDAMYDQYRSRVGMLDGLSTDDGFVYCGEVHLLHWYASGDLDPYMPRDLVDAGFAFRAGVVVSPLIERGRVRANFNVEWEAVLFSNMSKKRSSTGAVELCTVAGISDKKVALGSLRGNSPIQSPVVTSGTVPGWESWYHGVLSAPGTEQFWREPYNFIPRFDSGRHSRVSGATVNRLFLNFGHSEKAMWDIAGHRIRAAAAVEAAEKTARAAMCVAHSVDRLGDSTMYMADMSESIGREMRLMRQRQDKIFHLRNPKQRTIT